MHSRNSLIIRKRRGASAIGYGLVVGLISVVSLAAISGSGSSVTTLFGDVSDRMGAVATTGGSGSSSGSRGGAATPTATPEDLIQPDIVGISAPANGNYAAGDQLVFTITFTEPVTSTSGPYIGVEVGDDVLQLPYLSGSGSTQLQFAVTLTAPLRDYDGIRQQPNIRNDPGIVDLAGNRLVDNQISAQDLPGVTVGTVFTSCQDARNAGAVTDGVYTIDTTGGSSSDAYEVWCDMEGSTGWTLVLKTGSNSTTFHYDSSYWTNNTTLNATGLPDLGASDAKYRSFSELGADELRGCMDNLCFTYSSGLNGSQSARALFAGSNNQRYSSAIPGQFAQMDSCPMFGLNNNHLHGDSNGAGVRFGWVSNNGNCNDSENAIGFGVRNLYDGDFRASAGESCPLSTSYCDEGYTLNRFAGTMWVR